MAGGGDSGPWHPRPGAVATRSAPPSPSLSSVPPALSEPDLDAIVTYAPRRPKIVTTNRPLPRPLDIARCVRNGRWWGVDIADSNGVHVKGGYTQARRLDQVEGMVREGI